MSYSFTNEKNKSLQPLGESHSHSLGRFGTGYVDLVTGNLIIQSEDFAWSGRKMPVTIRHAYNSALKDTHFTYEGEHLPNVGDFSQYTLGKGFHLNFWQCLKYFNYPSRYAYYDENGQMTLLTMNDPNVNLYQDSDKTMSLRMNNHELERGGEFYRFNPTSLRLEEIYRYVECSDGTKTKLSTLITYDASGNTVTIKDGAGRNFILFFSNSRLTKMTAPDGSQITYAYNNSEQLTRINYPDNRYVKLEYNGPMLSEVVLGTVATTTDRDHYKVTYTYTANKVTAITEHAMGENGWIAGQSTTYTYDEDAHITSVVSSEESDEYNGTQELTTTYCFDVYGTLISQYLYKNGIDSEVVVPSGAGSGINPYLGDGGVTVTENVINLLEEHDFRSLNHWIAVRGIGCSGDPRSAASQHYSKYGKHCVKLTSTSMTGIGTGMYQEVALSNAGEYTFSTYINLRKKACGENNPGVYLRVTDASGNILCESEHIKETGGEPLRLITSFYVQNAGTIKVYILMDGLVTAFVSAAQLEECSYANKYNILYDSSFEKSFVLSLENPGWRVTSYDSNIRTTGEKLNGNSALKLTAHATTSTVSATQRVYAKTLKNCRETFTLSGWAKILSQASSKAFIRLKACICYTDLDNNTDKTFDFSVTFCRSVLEWQHASVQFAKPKFVEIKYIDILCEYEATSGIVCFDDVQLLCESCETDLSSSDFSDDNVEEDAIEETDVEEGFIETTDSYGNPLGETTFHDGEFGSMYRFFKYSGYGNNLREETDNRGNTTQYTVDDDTSQNKEIVDRCGNKTCYEYDDSGRTTMVASIAAKRDETGNIVKDDAGNILCEAEPTATVSYAYDAFDQFTEISRGDGMTFNLAYNNFHKLEGIYAPDGVYSVKYGYKNNNGRLKTVTYSNGWTMTATYNAYGQMVAERWTHRAKDPIEYKFVYDCEGNIVRSIDKSANKEYNYYYENGRVVRSAEFDVTFDSTGNYVTSKAFCVQVSYLYNADGEMTKKIIRDANGDEQIYKYTNPEGSNPVVTLPTGVVSQSKTDKFGRKEFDELQLGRAFMYRRFTYHDGSITGKNRLSENLKSTPTTNLVKEITLEDGRTLEYEYDEEERITKVTDSVDGVTDYTYDAQGQLTEERVTPVGSAQATRTTVMTYDNYGNILSKTTNDVTKTYEYNCTWKDKLTAVDGVPIVYDNLGNPISYLGHNLTWEKGRQLKRFTKADGTVIQYTYNTNGIRTSKTVGGVQHTYSLDGAKILKETWGDCTLIPLYDNEDSVCGIIYDDAAYYFHKNLQGDIIEIKNAYGACVARYTYDAWGKVIAVTDEDGFDVSDNAAHVANANPFRYRGYYYDEETHLYYISTRYYDSLTGKFLNSDTTRYLTICKNAPDCNLFAYCGNDPINNTDIEGELLPLVAQYIVRGLVGAAIGLAGLFIYDVVKSAVQHLNKIVFSSLSEYIISATKGAVDAFWGGGTAEVCKNVFATLIKIGINVFFKKQKYSPKQVGKEIFVTLIDIFFSWALGKLSVPIPKYIRDIKESAREALIKGTTALTNYLKEEIFYRRMLNLSFDYLKTVVYNTFKALFEVLASMLNSVFEQLKNAYSTPVTA